MGRSAGCVPGAWHVWLRHATSSCGHMESNQIGTLHTRDLLESGATHPPPSDSDCRLTQHTMDGISGRCKLAMGVYRQPNASARTQGDLARSRELGAGVLRREHPRGGNCQMRTADAASEFPIESSTSAHQRLNQIPTLHTWRFPAHCATHPPASGSSPQLAQHTRPDPAELWKLVLGVQPLATARGSPLHTRPGLPESDKLGASAYPPPRSRRTHRGRPCALARTRSGCVAPGRPK